MSTDHASLQKSVDHTQKHWAFKVAGWTVAVAGVTWTVADKLFIAPRDNQIAILQRQLDDLKAKTPAPNNIAATVPASDSLVLHETSVAAGSAVTSNDGMCQVLIDEIFLYSVNLRVTVGSEQSVEFKDVRAGNRITAKGKNGDYLVDIHRIREYAVDLSISRLGK